MFELVDANKELQDAKDPGIIWPEQNAIQKHVIACVSLKCIDLNRIQRRHFKIVIDAVNGAGAHALPAMLESLGCEVGAIVKSLVFRANDTFLICLVAGDKRCSLNKLKKTTNKKNVSMANAEEVKSNTGFSIGGVAPIAHLKKLNILIDQSLGRFKNVFAAAGHPNSIFKIEYNQLV